MFAKKAIEHRALLATSEIAQHGRIYTDAWTPLKRATQSSREERGVTTNYSKASRVLFAMASWEPF